MDAPYFKSYIKYMETDWDESKNASNKAKHGLAFEDFLGWDAEPVVLIDTRRDYGEERFIAFGRIDGRAHSLAYTLRDGKQRLISFRRAHDRELARYEQ